MSKKNRNVVYSTNPNYDYDDEYDDPLMTEFDEDEDKQGRNGLTDKGRAGENWRALFCALIGAAK